MLDKTPAKASRSGAFAALSGRTARRRTIRELLFETLPDWVKVQRMMISARMKTMPLLFFPIGLLRRNDKRVLVCRDTDLLITGYWRCANHYAAYAFITAQKIPVNVARHFHAPAQAMLAVRWNVPVLLLIREPVGAVSSSTVFFELDDPLPFLKLYNIYHEALIPYRDQLVVSDFKHTIADFGSVIAELNRVYGRQFSLYDGTQEEEQKVDKMIREEHRVGLHGRPTALPLPSLEKTPLTDKVKQRIREPRCAADLERAMELYQYFYATSCGAKT